MAKIIEADKNEFYFRENDENLHDFWLTAAFGGWTGNQKSWEIDNSKNYIKKTMDWEKLPYSSVLRFKVN